MLYFRHSELADKYHVSLKTVHNWIDAAKQDKLDLKLIEKGSRTYVANNPSNVLVLEKLSEQGKKFRNVRFHKVVSPKSEFYDLFNRRQIVDIINNLTVHREIPFQYNYLNGGATSWDSWVKRLASEEGPNNFNNSVELLRLNQSGIDQLLEGYERVNILDIGAGNAYPVRELLEHLRSKGLLHRYVAIDISESMLDIAEQNIKQWFGDSILFERHVRDVNNGRFDDLIVDDMLDSSAESTVNLFLLLGGTLANFRSLPDIVRNIYNSMGERDILAYVGKSDTESTRRYFDFHPNARTDELSPIVGFTLNMLNLDSSLYDIEMGYDEAERMRYIRIRLKTALTLKFKFGTGERNVSLERGDTLLLLRIRHMTALEAIAEFEGAGFRFLQSSMTRDKERMLALFGL